MPPDDPDPCETPGVAIRRHTDRCFHVAEEAWPDGYIVQGIFIPLDDIAETCSLDSSGNPIARCRLPRAANQPQSPQPAQISTPPEANTDP